LLAGCVAVPAVPMSASAEARDALAPTGSLRVGLDPRDATGISEGLARELARQLRVPAVIEPDADPVGALQAGRIDAAFVRANGDQRIAFSPPYVENYAIGIANSRSRALPFLRDFVEDAVERGVVRQVIRGQSPN
jgi:hypothetical protein